MVIIMNNAINNTLKLVLIHGQHILVYIIHLLGYMVNIICIHDQHDTLSRVHDQVLDQHTVIHLHGYMINLIHLQ